MVKYLNISCGCTLTIIKQKFSENFRKMVQAVCAKWTVTCSWLFAKGKPQYNL